MAGAKREVLGAFIRGRRHLANLSLRQLASMTSLSILTSARWSGGYHTSRRYAC